MDPFNIGHLGGAPVTAGAPATIIDLFTSAFEQTSKVESTLGIENEVRRRWADSLRQANISLNTVSPIGSDISANIVNRFVSERIDPDNTRIGANFFSAPGAANEEFAEQTFVRAKEINEQIKALRNPNIKSVEQILDDVLSDRNNINQRAQEVDERSGTFGWLPQLAGAMAGSFTTNDPLNLITLPVGGFGRTIGMKLLTEAGVGAGIEFLNQETSIQPTRQVLGEEQGDVFWNVTAAGIGAAAFRGLFEGLGAAAARLPAREPSAPLTLDFNDSQLASMFEARNPSVRAAASSLQDFNRFSFINPYGDSSAGLRRFETETDAIWGLMSGRAETAIARFMPEHEFSLPEIDFDTQIVRERQPFVFGRVEQAQTRLAEIDSQISDLTLRLDMPRTSDIVNEFDPQLAAQVRNIEDRIESGDFTDARRNIEVENLNTQLRAVLDRETGDTALRAQLSDAIARAGEPGLNEAVRRSRRQEVYNLSQRLQSTPYARAIENRETRLRGDLSSLRKERARVAAEYNSARDVLDANIAKVKQEREFKERFFAKPLEVASVPVAGEFNPQLLRPDVLTDFQRVVDETATTLPETLRTSLPSMIVKREGLPDLVDLGNGKVVEADMKFTDPDNPQNEVTAAELVSRMQEDEAMLEAMRECLL